MRDHGSSNDEEAIDVVRNDTKLLSAKESFREGWHAALRGETIPISELWEGIEGSEEEECDLD
jgi:hypothetical protein